MTTKDYYDAFIKKDDEGLCAVCGKQTKFKGIKQGYRSYCSNSCHQNDNEMTVKRVIKFKLSGAGREKRKETWRNKTREDLDVINARRQETNLAKYGVAEFSQTDEWKNNALEKIREKVNSYYESADSRELSKAKAKSYCENHGLPYEDYDNVFQIENVKNTIKKTKLEKYGDENFVNSEKIKKTCLERYGAANPMQNHEIFCKAKKKILKTMKELYGVEHALQNHEIFCKARKKYEFDGVRFDSKPEYEFFMILKENFTDFEYQPNVFFEYEFKGKTHRYFPDFKIGNVVYELKGAHFFKDGQMINPYDRNQDDLYEAKHKCMIENGVKIITVN